MSRPRPCHFERRNSLSDSVSVNISWIWGMCRACAKLNAFLSVFREGCEGLFFSSCTQYLSQVPVCKPGSSLLYWTVRPEYFLFAFQMPACIILAVSNCLLLHLLPSPPPPMKINNRRMWILEQVERVKSVTFLKYSVTPWECRSWWN